MVKWNVYDLPHAKRISYQEPSTISITIASLLHIVPDLAPKTMHDDITNWLKSKLTSKARGIDA